MNIKMFDATCFKNIKELMIASCEKYSENVAFCIKHKDENHVNYEDITYKRFLEDVNKLGTALFSIVMKGKRIAIIGKNRYEWVLVHVANLLGGIVSVPLDKDLKEEEFVNSILRSKPDILFFDEKLKDMICSVKEKNNTSISEFICMSQIDGFKNIGDLLSLGEKLIQNGNREFLDNKIDENAMNILLFTSGTTDKSKAVMLSHKNIVSNIYAMQRVEDIRSTDTNIAFLPFHHIFGSTCILMMLASGVKNVFPDGLRYIKQNLNEYKVTIFIGVPVLIEAIYRTINKELKKQNKVRIVNFALKISRALMKVHIDLRRVIFKQIIDALGGSLRSVIVGGAPADGEILSAFNDFGITTVQGYGLSETSPVIAGESYFVKKKGSVGIPMCNVEVQVVNKDESGVGEIRVKGPSVMLGYYEMEELTKEVLKDGWFYTGDLGYFDKDGILYITGRSKNLIVLKNGKKIFPEEIETVVNRLDIVQESMAFGMPDGGNEDDVKLSIKIVYDKEVAKDKYGNLSKEELYSVIWNMIKELNKSFPPYKHIKHLILTDEELIKTTTKKVKRQEEMKKILEGTK